MTLRETSDSEASVCAPWDRAEIPASITLGELLEERKVAIADLERETRRLRRLSRLCLVASAVNGAGAVWWLFG